jgi:hypothetical protein
LRYPEWFPEKPFGNISFLANDKTPNSTALMKRMRQGLAGISKIAGEEYQLLKYDDRLGISVPFGWAEEFHPYFERRSDKIKDYVSCYIWPADTKRQGSFIFNKPLDWSRKQSLSMGSNKYELSINHRVVLRHWNRGISSIYFEEADLAKPLFTKENFNQQTGRWNREQWGTFEKFLDDHFVHRFDWRTECNWVEKFTNTDRNYLDMCFGFEVGVYIPFALFKAVDKKPLDIEKVSELLYEIVLAFKTLIP